MDPRSQTPLILLDRENLRAHLGEELAHGGIGRARLVLAVPAEPVAAADHHQAVAAPLPAQRIKYTPAKVSL